MTHYLGTIVLADGGSATWRLSAGSVLEAAHSLVEQQADDPMVRAFLAGRGTLRVGPEQDQEGYPALDVAGWRECFQRNRVRCRWKTSSPQKGA